jgi:hypothetical protein
MSCYYYEGYDLPQSDTRQEAAELLETEYTSTTEGKVSLTCHTTLKVADLQESNLICITDRQEISLICDFLGVENDDWACLLASPEYDKVYALESNIPYLRKTAWQIYPQNKETN